MLKSYPLCVLEVECSTMEEAGNMVLYLTLRGGKGVITRDRRLSFCLHCSS